MAGVRVNTAITMTPCMAADGHLPAGPWRHASDKPAHCSKSIASLLLRTAKAVLVCDRTIQMLAPTAEIDNVTITAEMQSGRRWDRKLTTSEYGRDMENAARFPHLHTPYDYELSKKALH